METPIISNMELTQLGSKPSIYYEEILDFKIILLNGTWFVMVCESKLKSILKLFS